MYLRDAREIHTANRRNQQRWRPQCSAASRLKSANGADECWLVHLAVKRSRSGERQKERKGERQRGRGQRHCLRLAFRFLACANFMAIYFVPAKQLSHHQSFCLKEYIAIKSRKYAFTLAKSATQFPSYSCYPVTLSSLPTLPFRFPSAVPITRTFPLPLFMRHNTWPEERGKATPTAFWLLQKLLAALAEEAASTACTARLLLLMFYYPQQIKIASFCPAQCKSCLVMPTSEAGVQFNARHSINCPAEGRRSFNEMTQPQPEPEPESIHRNGLKMKTSRNTK